MCMGGNPKMGRQLHWAEECAKKLLKVPESVNEGATLMRWNKMIRACHKLWPLKIARYKRSELDSIVHEVKEFKVEFSARTTSALLTRSFHEMAESPLPSCPDTTRLFLAKIRFWGEGVFDPSLPRLCDLPISSTEKCKRFQKFFYKQVLAPKIVKGKEAYEGVSSLVMTITSDIEVADVVEFDAVQAKTHGIALEVLRPLRALAANRVVRSSECGVGELKALRDNIAKAPKLKFAAMSKRSQSPVEVMALAIDASPFWVGRLNSMIDSAGYELQHGDVILKTEETLMAGGDFEANVLSEWCASYVEHVANIPSFKLERLQELLPKAAKKFVSDLLLKGNDAGSKLQFAVASKLLTQALLAFPSDVEIDVIQKQLTAMATEFDSKVRIVSLEKILDSLDNIDEDLPLQTYEELSLSFEDVAGIKLPSQLQARVETLVTSFVDLAQKEPLHDSLPRLAQLVYQIHFGFIGEKSDSLLRLECCVVYREFHILVQAVGPVDGLRASIKNDPDLAALVSMGTDLEKLSDQMKRSQHLLPVALVDSIREGMADAGKLTAAGAGIAVADRKKIADQALDLVKPMVGGGYGGESWYTGLDNDAMYPAVHEKAEHHLLNTSLLDPVALVKRLSDVEKATPPSSSSWHVYTIEY
jgi:hypothetical protein